jgi:hypothetical protein
MIRLPEIQEALLNVVGWQQDYNPQNQIDDALCQTESGLTFQGAHPLCTLANIRSIMPDDYLYYYPAWNQIQTYKKGMKIRHNGFVWIANHDNVGIQPEASDFNMDFNNDFGSELAGAWVKYSMQSDFVRQLTVNGINTAIQTFIQEKQLQQETRNLLERRTFFDGAARLQATIDPSGKIVGFEIVPVRSMGVTTKIERIGLQMVGATGKVHLYLFHSSQVIPMRKIDLDFTNTNGGFQWFTPSEPIYLPYIPGTDDGNDSGGAWFLCYSQNELPLGMQALNVSKDWSVEPCQACIGGSIESWRQMTKYLQVSPFCINAPADFGEYHEMFDIGQLAYTNTMNYGLNVEISVGCDLTDFIISQRHIFATVIQKQVAANVLRTIAMNPDVRVNRNQVNVTRDELLYEIDGAPQGRATGLGYELKQAYKALSIDTRGLDRICLQCNNHGVKYRTV